MSTSREFNYSPRFDTTTAIVTGAGSGIGRATAVRLAAEGARVVAVDIVEERLNELACELGDRVVAMPADIAEPGVEVAALDAAGGAVDVLINVAGIMDGYLPVGEMDDATWDRVLAVNLTSMMRFSRAVIAGMLERRAGAIVNVASYAGSRGSCAGAAYTASKHGVIGLTRSTAFMYEGTGIRANCVAPGPVPSSIDATVRSELGYSRVKTILDNTMPEPGTPEQLAAAICWLACSDADNVTGAVLQSDGGWSTK
jgi:NAD(P)-dependent dehydrogenase (short-subunit alcohol dehydrogenase family)